MKNYHLQNPKCLTIFHSNLTSLKIGTEVLYPTHKMCRSYIFKSMMVSLLKTSKSQIFLRFEQQLVWCIYISPNSFMSVCLCTVVRFFDNTKKHMLKRAVNVVAWTFHLTEIFFHLLLRPTRMWNNYRWPLVLFYNILWIYYWTNVLC